MKQRTNKQLLKEAQYQKNKAIKEQKHYQSHPDMIVPIIIEETNELNPKIINIECKHRKYNKAKLSLQYRRYISRANAKSMAFELTPEQFDIMLTKDCTYCGIENANGVDRIDSSLGYTVANSCPCCAMCNMMKLNYSLNKFVKHIERIYNHIHQ